jgi:phosphoenolpyruvate-protein phosphotransferase
MFFRRSVPHFSTGVYLPHMAKIDSNRKLSGQGISPGLALGKAFVYEDILRLDQQRYAIVEEQVEREYARIEWAIERVLRDLKQSADRVEEDLNAELAAIFHAHHAILGNSSLAKELREELEKELVNAEEVIKRVFRRWERKLSKSASAMPSSPDHDIADIGRRLLRALAGIHAHALESVPEGSVLIASRLLPSDTIHLSRQSVVAVVVAFAGPGSHAALLIRQLGIPGVAQLPGLLDEIAPEEVLLVDGSSGTVIASPDDETLNSFRRRMAEETQAVAKVREHCRQPAVSKDGVRVDVMANIGCREDAILAVENGADGVGLYRLESVYLSRKALPTEDELFAEMKNTLEPFRDKTSTVRLLDTGGDKAVPGLDLPHEANPFLGRRGVRLLLEYPELLQTQLRTFLRIAQEQPIQILVPMVTLSEEMQQVRKWTEEMGRKVGLQELPPIGAMIETPAAALCAADIAAQADFLSIGTNDLTQYTMVAGRENPLVDHYFQDSHPAILRLLQLIANDAGNTPLSLCGELASREDTLQVLLDLGIHNFSVAPHLIPAMKQAVRNRRANSRGIVDVTAPVSQKE